jgi:hypothetical protein
VARLIEAGWRGAFRRARLALAASLFVTLGGAVPAHGFPPYRSTDAGTADPGVFEARLGLLRMRHDSGDNLYASPLLRLNLGLVSGLELVSELEVRPGHGGLVDAAVGGKWVPLRGQWSMGMETLLLLPVPNAGGVGVESQLVLTYRDEGRGIRIHLNGGGFADGRAQATEKGWRGSVLAELPRGRYRPGFEVFARRVGSRSVEVLAGPGIIIKVGRRADLRFGLHFGLTEAAPDLVLDAWASTEVGVW